MWLFTKHGFYSISVSIQDPKYLQIRARNKKHLENLMGYLNTSTPATLGKDTLVGYLQADLPKQKKGILETPNADYPYRLLVDRGKFPALAWLLINDIDYSNFKNEIFGDRLYHDIAARVWGICLGLTPKKNRENQGSLWSSYFQDNLDEDDPENKD